MGINSIIIADDNDQFIKKAIEYINKNLSIPLIGISFNGNEAIKKIEKIMPDIVIIDIALTGINGLEGAAEIKKMENPPRVIITSDYDNSDYRNLALKAGADAFIAKEKFDTQFLLILKMINSNIGNLFNTLHLAKN